MGWAPVAFQFFKERGYTCGLGCCAWGQVAVELLASPCALLALGLMSVIDCTDSPRVDCDMPPRTRADGSVPQGLWLPPSSIPFVGLACMVLRGMLDRIPCAAAMPVHGPSSP